MPEFSTWLIQLGVTERRYGEVLLMLTQEEGNLPVPLTHSPYSPIEIIPQALVPSRANN